VLITGISGGFYWYSAQNAQTAAAMGDVIVHPVKRDRFVHFIAQRGEIESASNIDVYCEVKSGTTGSAGVAILDVIPEGTQVKRGEKLATLDSSALEKERTAQQILCNTSEALLIQSTNLHETAKIALREYIDGTYVQAEQTILGEIFVAEENLRRAEGYLKYSEELAARNFYTTLQLEADRFAVDKAKNDLETAKTKLKVLRDYTRLKTIKQMEADIKTTEAKMRTDESTHTLDMQKLAEIDAQIAKCTILAPADGQVVYNNDEDDWDDNPTIIQPGALVRERQIIFKLPDPAQMQVEAKINEGNVNRVEVGMVATIKVDAFPDRELHGVVTKINDYPERTGWRGSNVKEYAAFVKILEPPTGLRPGMTSDVSILVEELPDMLQVPVQAVVEHNGQHYCLVRARDHLEARQVQLGSTNDKYLIVEDGLREGEDVLLNPRLFLESVDLPSIAAVSATAQRAAPPVKKSADQDNDRLAVKAAVPAKAATETAEASHSSSVSGDQVGQIE
jgi:RND family efflux transporter MFP subunit